jgi:rhodanese-related sulfurtransferase
MNLRTIVQFVVALHCTSALSQVAPGNTLPQALQHIARATQVCKREDFTTPRAQDTAAPVPDLSCLVNVPDALPFLAQANSILVDLRPAAQYQQAHIPQAMALTLSELTSKPYWRSKTVVLVGSGKDEDQLLRACSHLKQNGYAQVKVLRGGLAQWLLHQQPVLGSPSTQEQLIRISAEELWSEARHAHNLVLLAPQQHLLHADIKAAIDLPQLSASAIQTAVRTRPKNTLARIILATSPTTTHEQIQALRSALSPVPLLIYTDTQQAYQHHVTTQQAQWLAQARGPKQPACGL